MRTGAADPSRRSDRPREAEWFRQPNDVKGAGSGTADVQAVLERRDTDDEPSWVPPEGECDPTTCYCPTQVGGAPVRRSFIGSVRAACRVARGKGDIPLCDATPSDTPRERRCDRE